MLTSKHELNRLHAHSERFMAVMWYLQKLENVWIKT